MATHPPDRKVYARLGQAGARSPVVLSVPHAGRHYPPALLAASRLPQEALETIEDRHADLLVSDSVRDGAVAIVACLARAYVDLNRDEREIDPMLLREPAADGALITSAKTSGGLGVVPSRIAAGGAVWRDPPGGVEIGARIAFAHRPYHEAIALALDEATACHGTAILVDCHSMPTLGRGAPQVVIGDRYGRSAGPRFVSAAAAAMRRAGFRVAINHPYAGGHTLDRHGSPSQGRHAIQIEIDRALYLDTAQREPAAGLSRARSLVAAIAHALVDEISSDRIAAE